jgi:hypothetical protein
MTSGELIRAVGEALWSERHWRAEMASALGVGDRVLRRWATGARTFAICPTARTYAVLAERHRGASARGMGELLSIAVNLSAVLSNAP